MATEQLNKTIMLKLGTYNLLKARGAKGVTFDQIVRELLK